MPAPADVSATDATFDDRIGIGWADPSDLEDGYFIFRDGAAYDTTAANATSYSDLDAEPDSTYTYCVRAFSDSGGVSVDGCDEGFRSIVLAPDWVQATDGDFENRVEITWESASTTAALSKIYRDGLLIKTALPDSRSYSDFGGTAGVDYAYCVTGVTALEDESARTCDPGRRTLLAPSVVQASDESFEDRVLISWVDHSEVESGYHVYRRASSETDSVLIGTREQYLSIREVLTQEIVEDPYVLLQGVIDHEVSPLLNRRSPSALTVSLTNRAGTTCLLKHPTNHR